MNPLKILLIAMVQFYRWFLSPLKTALFGPQGRCRYTPSCSAYALEAIRRHGALYGSWLAICRLGRCHPWADSGHDPVPQKRPVQGQSDEACCARSSKQERSHLLNNTI